jgi:FixJ family two-component response regulator
MLAGSQDFRGRLERFLANRQTAGPVLRQSAGAAAQRDKREQGTTIPGKRLISIVEDDTGVRESMGRLIVCLGHASSTFVTAEAYLESELLGETACLICDVRLPGMSGPDLQARLIADGHRIPIVFVTGHFSETTRAHVLTAGAIDYLAKPFDPRVLIGCLEKALASTPS